MPPGHPAKKGIKFLDAKVLIATLSIAVTIGLWNLFSVEAVNAAKPDPAALQSPPPDQASEQENMPPLPTLVPLVDVSQMLQQEVSAGEAPATQPQSTNNKLRSVGAPPVTIVQKGKPMVNDAVVSVGGGGGSRTSGRTRSSR